MIASPLELSILNLARAALSTVRMSADTDRDAFEAAHSELLAYCKLGTLQNSGMSVEAQRALKMISTECSAFLSNF